MEGACKYVLAHVSGTACASRSASRESGLWIEPWASGKARTKWNVVARRKVDHRGVRWHIIYIYSWFYIFLYVVGCTA